MVVGMRVTKADLIRGLSSQGLSVSEIAATANVRYQHAYHVLKRSGLITANPRKEAVPIPPKPSLTAATLLDAGFRHASTWILDDKGVLILSEALPKEVGVYAFVKDGVVLYIGVATMGLAKRIYFYAKPGVTQRTSLRLNDIIRRELEAAGKIDVLIAQPNDMKWNGLPVHGAAGLELGLIKAYALPWNMRSAK
jgi:hypothetical protein